MGKLIIFQTLSDMGCMTIGNMYSEKIFKTGEDISDLIKEIKDEHKAKSAVILNIIELPK